MIHLPPAASSGAPLRLIDALARRGVVRAAAPGASAGGHAAERDRPATLVCAEGLSPQGLERLVAEWSAAGAVRLLVLSRLGAHPDARAAGLRALWTLEERARSTGLPALTLRLAPLVGPASPLWLELSSGPRLPRGGRWLLNPACEEDAVETVARALEWEIPWEGWFEIAGPEVVSLAELAALAQGWARGRPPAALAPGSWEPPAAELAEHRLAEAGPWLERFGLSVPPLSERVRGWEPVPGGVAGSRSGAPAGSAAA